MGTQESSAPKQVSFKASAARGPSAHRKGPEPAARWKSFQDTGTVIKAMFHYVQKVKRERRRDTVPGQTSRDKSTLYWGSRAEGSGTRTHRGRNHPNRSTHSKQNPEE